jgi:class 3 adenylate cyclase
MRCQACNVINHPSTGSLCCVGCGAALPMVCRSCHYVNVIGARFCSGCGRQLDSLPGGQVTEHGPAERRQISVVFCDLVNSSVLAARTDPEDFRDLLLAYQRRCTEVIARYEGHVAQYLGDGLLVYFGYPTAQEDAAQRALRASRAMVSAVQELIVEGVAGQGVALQLRVGIHTGAVVVGAMGGGERIEFLAVGETPNTAARIQSAAAPGTVVVSDTTFRLARGYFAFEDLGVFNLKGVATPLRLHQVLGETAARTRLDAAARELSRFIGRDRELGQLQQWWTAALEGNAPFVLLSGEPGIGKSRQLRMLCEALGSDCLRIEGHCSPLLRARALHPVVQMLDRRLDLAAAIGAKEKLTRLAAELELATVTAKPALALLAQLLDISHETDGLADLSPQRQRQLTFEVLLDWIDGLTRLKPVLLMIEDVHWADPSTLEFLSAVLERRHTGPVMTVLTHRPEFQAPWSSPRLRDLALGRLPLDHARELIAGVIGTHTLPAAAITQILQKAEGVPLFIEEITQAVLESSEAPRGESSFAPDPTLTIPATLQDSLAARLDRLQGGKGLLQLASAIGRSIPFALLCAVLNSPEETLRVEIERLVAAGLLLQRGNPPREQYVFKHALIQDAAYASLIKSARQDFHARIAHTLSLNPQSEAEPEILAEHYAGAGMPLAASEHYARAGQRAIARSAFSEAIAIFGRALDLLLSMPPSLARDRGEIELLAGLGLAQLSTRGFSSREVEETYTRARNLCERYGDVPMRILFGVWAVQIVRGDVDATGRLVPVFESKIAGGQEDSTALIAHAALATRAFHLGNYEVARQHALAAIPHCNVLAPRAQFEQLVREHGYEGLLYPHLFSAWAHLHLGHVTEGQLVLQEALAVADKTELPYVRAMANAYAAAYAMDAGDVDQALVSASIASQLCTQHSYPFWLGCALCIEGWANVRHDQFDIGLSKLDQGLATLHGIGASIMIPYYTGCMASAQLKAGRAADALATARRVNEMPESRVWRFCSSEFARLEGEALLELGETAQAEDRLRAAWADAQASESRVWAVSAALSLASFLAGRGDREGARTLLISARDALPERADLPVLAPAWRLLDSLS